ncbi:MAG: V-type ATPase 116kDa subunit family protein [Bacteroidales bacterium]
MITPMYKYSFLIFHQEYEHFLDKLQELGVLHVIEKNEEVNENTREKLHQISELNKTLTFLQRREQEEKPVSDEMTAFEVMTKKKELQEEINTLEQENLALDKDIQRATPWGNIPADMLKKYEQMGLTIRFFTCNEKRFEPEWKEAYYLEPINIYGGQIYFVILQREEEAIDIDAEEIRLPETPLKELQKKRQENEERLEAIQATFDEFAVKYQQAIRDTMEEMRQQTAFEYTLEQTEKQADEKIMVLEGWVPETKVKDLEAFLNQEEVLFLSEKAKQNANAPILLKNGKFSRLFEPVGDLFSLPSYGELDMTPFFAPFFMLFFGFCVGDTGYGLFILLVTLFLRNRVKPSLKPIMGLAAWLGGATILMGAVSGTFFGINLAESDFVPFKEIFLEPLQLFYLAIILGIIQIIFGMFLKAISQVKQYGFKYGVSTMGWILLILSSAFFLGGETLGWFTLSGALAIAQNGFLVISLGMILLFSNPDKNIFANIGIGIYDVYNMVTGVFGDMLSYIRLFALGISSAILGLVFNQIASQFLGMGILGWLLFVVVLLIGHSLNIFLAGLGAFVHPLRLTFVEFYKNAGFTGGGKQYKPFSK